MSPSAQLSLAVPLTAVIAVALTLAVLHLLLLAFERDDRRSLYFTLLATAFSLVVFLDYR